MANITLTSNDLLMTARTIEDASDRIDQALQKLDVIMSDLDSVSKGIYGAVNRYYGDLKTEGKDIAGKAGNLFWQLSEKEFQSLNRDKISAFFKCFF